MRNIINWFEIPVKDIQRAKAFYESIFDIDLLDMPINSGPNMVLFPMDKNSISGALVEHPDFYIPSEKGVLLYLNANPDLKEVENKVKENGGKIIIPKRMISPDHGYMAVINDSEGNRIALHSDS